MNKSKIIIIAASALLFCAGCAQSVVPSQPAIVNPPAGGTLPGGFTTQGSVLTSYSGTDKDVVIPAGITRIGERAFLHTDVRSVVIPDSVTEIGDLAFAGTNLAEVLVPASVNKVGAEAFGRNTGLKKVTFESKKIAFEDSVFYDCSALESVTLPEKQDALASFMFHACPNLKNISIPDSVHTIAKRAFYKTGLSEVILPANLQRIEDNAFEDNPALKSMVLSNAQPDPAWTSTTDKKGIGAYAFMGTRITSFTVPPLVAKLSGWSFIGADELQELVIPETVRSLEKFISQGSATLKVRFLHADPETIEIDENSFPNKEKGFLMFFSDDAHKKIIAVGDKSRWKNYKSYIATK